MYRVAIPAAFGAVFVRAFNVLNSEFVGVPNSGRWGVGLVVAHMLVASASGDTLLAMLPPDLVALVSITVGTRYQKRFYYLFDLRSESVIQFLSCLAVTALAAIQTETG